MDFLDFFSHFVFAHSTKSQPAQKIPGFGKKKLSQELKTSVSPKSNQLVPTYRGLIDQLL